MPRNRRTEVGAYDYRDIGDIRATVDALKRQIREAKSDEELDELRVQLAEDEETLAQKIREQKRLKKLADEQSEPIENRMGFGGGVVAPVENDTRPTDGVTERALRLLDSRHHIEQLSDRAATSPEHLLREDDPIRSESLAHQVDAVDLIAKSTQRSDANLHLSEGSQRGELLIPQQELTSYLATRNRKSVSFSSSATSIFSNPIRPAPGLPGADRS